MSVLSQEDLVVLSQSGVSEKFNTKVVGTSFRDPDVIESVDDGQFFVLVPELDNEHDADAVMVVRNEDEAHVGYISRDFNKRIKDAILKGDKFLAKATVTGRDKENRGINLLVLKFSGEQ